MVKKLLFVFILLISCINAHAQFEEGKWYLNTSLTGLNLSHSKYEGTNFGFQVGSGAFVVDNLMVLVNFKGEYVEHGMDETSVGAGARYYLSNCGLYGGLGLAYKHLSNSVNRKDLVCLTPELGYAFFLNGTITVEPAVYYDLVIVDTAGRLAVDEQMMNEIEAIKNAINPDETLFVVDSMTGQDAVNTAREFNERLDFNGVVLTKLDGDTRGGAALSIRTVVNKPIKFVGTGEKLDAIDQFHPARMADRILGMGDIVSLVERAQEQYDEEEAKRLQKKIQKNQFDFNDFLTQIHQIKKMGNLKELASMIPGVGKAIKDIDIDDNAFKSIEAIIYSMTPEERTHPEILNGTRRTRIAKGSGTSIQEVNRLLKQFDQTRKMMKMVTGSKMAGMMQKMKKNKIFFTLSGTEADGSVLRAG